MKQSQTFVKMQMQPSSNKHDLMVQRALINKYLTHAQIGLEKLPVKQ